MLENVHVIDELLSTDSTTDDFKNELEILKGNVMTFLKKVAPTVVSNWEKTHPPNRGPGLPQEGGCQVSLLSCSFWPNPSVPCPPAIGPTAKRRKRSIPQKFYMSHLWQCFLLQKE